MPRWHKDGKQGDYCRAPGAQASSGNGGKRAQLEGASPACRGQHCSAPAGRQNLRMQPEWPDLSKFQEKPR